MNKQYYIGANGASDNTNVVISGTEHNGSAFTEAYGGYAYSPDVPSINNHLTIHLPREQTLKYAIGGYSEHDAANSNTVNIDSDGVINHVYGGYSSFSSSENNRITLKKGTVKSSFYGGYSEERFANSNTVEVINGNIDGHVCGGLSEWNVVANNTVKVSGGTITQGYIQGGLSLHGQVKSNTVHISGGTINACRIYGGWSQTGTLNGNRVILSGNPNLAGTNIYGGYIMGDKKVVKTENVLEIRTKSLDAVGYVQGFESIVFTLPFDIKANETILSVNEIDISNCAISVGMLFDKNASLKEGDRITLVHASDSLTGFDSFFQTAFTQGQDVLSHYEFILSADQQSLFATVTKVEKVSVANG